MRKNLVRGRVWVQLAFMDRERALKKLQETCFYGIVDAGYVELSEMAQVARELCEGGAGVIQLRAKGVDEKLVEEKALELISVCRELDVVFVLNDYAEMAARLGADGLHIGQDDGSFKSAVDVVWEGVIIGRSTHSVEQALEARDQGFDYIGFGPLFPTPTKKGRPGIGMDSISKVESEVGSKIPVFCIGGIKESNLDSVVEAGAKRVVVVSDVLTASDRVSKVRSIVRTLDK